MLTAQVVISTIIWLVGVTAAAILLAWELWQCRLDGQYIDAMGWNGPMHVVLRRDIRVGLMRLSMALSYDLLGILVLIAPGSLLVRIDFTLTLLWSATGLLLNSILDRRNRHYVALAEGHDEDYLPSALRVQRRSKLDLGSTPESEPKR